MKLLLASSGRAVHKLLPKVVHQPIEELAIGWVTTASKGVEDSTYLKIHRHIIEDLGWNFEEIDIENKTKDELQRLFSDKDIIHIEGRKQLIDLVNWCGRPEETGRDQCALCQVTGEEGTEAGSIVSDSGGFE